MENTAGGKYRRKHNRSKPYERKQKVSALNIILRELPWIIKLVKY